MNNEGCQFHKCLVIALKNSIEYSKNKYTVTLVEERYGSNEEFKGQDRYGNFKLNYCPECGKEIDIEKITQKIIKKKRNDGLFRYKK